MNRLTTRIEGVAAQAWEHEEQHTHAEWIDLLQERLAAYEDTGLEPEEVTAAKHALMGKTLAEIKEFEGIPLDRLRELAEAERDSRAVVLPCKIGDTVYMPKGRWKMTGYEPDTCDGFHIARDGVLQIKVKSIYGTHGTYGVPGKTAFLTSEEAEEAMKGGGDHEE